MLRKYGYWRALAAATEVNKRSFASVGLAVASDLPCHFITKPHTSLAINCPTVSCSIPHCTTLTKTTGQSHKNLLWQRLDA